MELYTVEETARLLRVSPITIRRYIAAGELEAVRVGRGVRVHREAIDRFVRPLPGTETRPHRKPVSESVDRRPANNGLAQSDYRADSEAGNEYQLTILESLNLSVGIGRSSEPTNIAEYKDEYLADAFEAKG